MIALSLVLYGFIKRRNIPKSDSPVSARLFRNALSFLF